MNYQYLPKITESVKKKIIEEFKNEYAKRTKIGKYARKGTEDYYAQLTIDEWDRLLMDITINTILSFLRTSDNLKVKSK
jgi:hypothetical protein